MGFSPDALVTYQVCAQCCDVLDIRGERGLSLSRRGWDTGPGGRVPGMECQCCDQLYCSQRCLEEHQRGGEPMRPGRVLEEFLTKRVKHDRACLHLYHNQVTNKHDRADCHEELQLIAQKREGQRRRKQADPSDPWATQDPIGVQDDEEKEWWIQQVAYVRHPRLIPSICQRVCSYDTARSGVPKYPS